MATRNGVGRLPSEFFDFAEEIIRLNKAKGYKQSVTKTKIMRSMVKHFKSNRGIIENELIYLK